MTAVSYFWGRPQEHYNAQANAAQPLGIAAGQADSGGMDVEREKECFGQENGEPQAEQAQSKLHSGHRERVRKRFLEEGLDHFQPHEVLEFLLFYTRRQGDTNPLGHRLLDELGSLSQVLDAPYEQLRRIPGVGDQTAVFLKLLPAVAKRYLEDKQKSGTIITSVEDVWDQFRFSYVNAVNELVYALFLDNKNKIIKRDLLFEGSVNTSSVPRRKLMELAITTNASGVVLSHNHPNGIAIPSKADVETTRKLLMVLNFQGINLVDHLIVAGDNYCSLRESGMIPEWK